MKFEKIEVPDGFGCVLPKQRSRAELRNLLTRCSTITDRDRNGAPAARMAASMKLLESFFPTDPQLKFAVDFDCVLRAGYQFRNEALRGALQIDLGAVAKKIERELSGTVPEDGEDDGLSGVQPEIAAPTKASSPRNSNPRILTDPIRRMSAAGLRMTLLGIPQMGKSAAVDRVLELYDQVVERGAMSKQVVWLKLTCPPDDNLPEFCKAFFVELDRALGHDCYTKLFAHEYASRANMAGHVLRLANIHSLGILVVDDVYAPSSMAPTSKSIWHLLHSLSTIVGVPVVTIGTMAAAEYLMSSAGVAFRSVGIGSNCWTRLRRGEQWRRFVQALWTQQWTNTPTPYTEELGETLYHCCQGVIGLAVSLYHTVQHQLISVNADRVDVGDEQIPEVITADMIDTVYQVAFAFCHEHVDALRSDDVRLLRQYPDLRPLDAVPPPPPQPKPSSPSADSAKPGESAGEAATVKSALKDSASEEHDVLRLARQILRESNVPDEMGQSWLNSLTTEIESNFDTEAREFMRRLEARIKHWSRKTATWTFSSAANHEVGDLRTLLDTRKPAAKVLEQAGISGRRLFRRR